MNVQFTLYTNNIYMHRMKIVSLNLIRKKQNYTLTQVIYNVRMYVRV